MFSKRVKHYHQWLRSPIPFKAKLDQISSDSVRVQGPTKRPSLGHLYPVSPVKELHRKGRKCKISRVLQSPVLSTQASPKVEASHRLKQAQHFSTRRKVQNGNSRVHQDLPDSRGVGIVDRSVGRLPTHPSLDRSHCSPPRLVAKSLQCDERCRPSSQRPQYPTLYRRLKRRLGRSLRPKFYKGSVVRSGKKATHKCPRIEGGLPGPSRLQGPVPESNSVGCDGQLNSGSLHQQTRRNTLGRDVCSPVEDHDLVPSLPHNIESQAHSRVPECDGRPAIQVQPSAVNRMVSAPTGVQTDLPEVVHTSCRLICHSLEPQIPSIRVSYPRPKGLGHRCSEHKLDQPHGLCVPSYGPPSS